jgi:hypothetical protein
MGRRIKVVVCGETLLMAALQASIASDPEIELVPLRDEILTEETLRECRPDAVIFDAARRLPFEPAPVDELPDLLLVGVDPATNCVQVWRGRQFRELSTRGLLEVIADLSQTPRQEGGAPPSDTPSI